MEVGHQAAIEGAGYALNIEGIVNRRLGSVIGHVRLPAEEVEDLGVVPCGMGKVNVQTGHGDSAELAAHPARPEDNHLAPGAAVVADADGGKRAVVNLSLKDSGQWT
ncbi:MAG: hypothetical protein ACLQGJ_04580 [Candidatus Dormibacteria bacterium]